MASTSTAAQDVKPEAPARPPPGYAALKVSAADVLLELTISNKCGQAFRWRSVQVWEPLPAPNEVGIQVKKEETDDGAEDKSAAVRLEEQTEYSLCLPDRVVLLRQDRDLGFLYHRTLLPSANRASGDLTPVEAEPSSIVAQETAEWLVDYLSLRVPVTELTVHWASRDAVFAKHSPRFTGLRMLRQDPWECLCAFICSSNNNIARIGQMVSKLCTAFMPPLLEYTYPPPPAAQESSLDRDHLALRIQYHPFPPASRLAEDGVEQRLRELGFGYRAKYLAATAQMLCAAHPHPEPSLTSPSYLATGRYDALDQSRLTLDGITSRDTNSTMRHEEARPRVKRRRTAPNDEVAEVEPVPSQHSVTSYLASLRDMPYGEARDHLIQFPGVGPKVADCILLMSMDQPSSIPVDRHVFNFAERYYGMRGASSKGHKGYEDVAKKLRELWGGWAGWAHSVLFTAELRSFAQFEQPLVKKEEEVAAPPVIEQKPALMSSNSAPAVLTASSGRLSFASKVNAGVKGRREQIKADKSDKSHSGMPRTIVVVDGTGVQGEAVIEMLLNANVAVQQNPSQSSTGGTRPKHLPPADALQHRFPASTSHGDAFRKLEEVDPVPAPTLPKRPSLPSFRSSDGLKVDLKAVDDQVVTSRCASPQPPSYKKSGSNSSSITNLAAFASHQPSPCSTPEEELIVAAADAATVTVGPNVLSTMPGYFASSHSQQALPSSLSMLTPTAELATPELLPRLELPPVSEAHSISTDVSSSSDYSSAVETPNCSLRYSTPPISPPKRFRKDIEISTPPLRPCQGEEASKSSSTSANSANSGSKSGGAGVEEMYSPPGTTLCELGAHNSTLLKSAGPAPVWKLRSLVEGSPVDTLRSQNTSTGKWAGMVESRIVKYDSPASLQDAMTGIHGLFFGLDAFSSSPRLFLEEHVRNIVHAAVRANVQHVIYAGHIGDEATCNIHSTHNDKPGHERHRSADIDMSTLPVTVQRCTIVYRILRKLASSGLFRLTIFKLPVCFEAALLCENSWFSLQPKTNTYVLDIPVPSNTVMPFCSLADVGNAALQVFSRPERFDGLVLDLTSDIASPRELAVQMTQVVYVSGKKIVHAEEQSNWLSEQLTSAAAAASEGDDAASKQSLMGPKTVNMILLREFLLFMSSSTKKPLTLLLPQVRTNARKHNLRLTPWREFAVNFCDDLLVAWR
ncbi:8-oxoguanine glycosylase ogg1 [Tilletia horrida]|nr:8-oxoguanine glycosylase ogg1 [Tilletia horrida]